MALLLNDIFHPLATLEWERCAAISGGNIYPNCVFLNDKVYLAVAEEPHLLVSKLYAFDSDFTSHEVFEDLPVEGFALTTYHSQLVLVGGRDDVTYETLGFLWTSNDGKNWQGSLPPMRIERYCAVAVNTGNPECLIVAGGQRAYYSRPKVRKDVEVFVDGEWFFVCSLPWADHSLGCCVHNGNLIIVGGDVETYPSLCCKVDALLAEKSPKKKDFKPSIWKFFSDRLYVQSAVSTGQHVLVFRSPGYIEAFVPSMNKFIRVGRLPFLVTLNCSVASTMLSTGELVFIAIDASFTDPSCTYVIHKGSLKQFDYDRDGEITIHAMSRLQVAGFKHTCLTAIGKELKLAAKAVISDDEDSDDSDSYHPPTWSNLRSNLLESCQEELSLDIENFLSGGRCLKERCLSTIVSAILQNGPVVPDQLNGLLPAYIPATVKAAIIHEVKACMLDLMPFHSIDWD